MSFIPVIIAFLSFQPIPASQLEDKVLILKDGTELRYAISTPKLADSSQSVPLVLALHYGWRGSSVPEGYGRQFLSLLIHPAFERMDCVIVAPDCPSRSWTDSKSEQAVLELRQHIESQYPIDPDRRVVTGFSLGGFGAWYFGTRHADTFSAAIPIAGRPRLEWLEGAENLNLFVIHSRKDEIVPIAPTEKAVEELKRRGANPQFLVIDSLTHYETGRYVTYLQKAVAWLEQLWSAH
jgi:predicted peptidase